MYEELYLQKGADGALRVELDSLKRDNDRLLRMLKQTKEFAEFADFIEDSGGQVKSVLATSNNLKVMVDLESEHWVPNEAYTLAHSFRERHGSDLTPTLINQLLGDLNKIWRERERKQIARFRAQAHSEIN